jgi:hypothetical protein
MYSDHTSQRSACPSPRQLTQKRQRPAAVRTIPHYEDRPRPQQTVELADGAVIANLRPVIGGKAGLFVADRH